MKQIELKVYRCLTPKQRVIASIEAIARGDENEERRLVRSCPRYSYTQIDLRYLGMMEALLDLALAVEADLKECVLRFLIVAKIDPEEANDFLQDFADTREAWRSTVSAMGLDEEAMALAGPPTSPVFALIEKSVPTPDIGKAEEISAVLLRFLEEDSQHP